MLKELLQAVTAQAVAANSPQFSKFDPYQYSVYRDSAGAMQFVEPETPWRKHDLSGIDDLAQFAHDHIPVGQTLGSVFYNRHEIVLLVSDEERFDRATVKLTFSAQMAKLMKLSGTIPQPELRKQLRTTFYGNIDEDLCKKISAMKWNQTSDRATDVGRGKASMGTAIRKEFSGVDEIPEYVIFRVPVWESKVDFLVDVKCILDPCEADGQFILEPLPGVIERVLFQAEEEIGRRLAIALKTGEDGSGPCFLYHGSP